MFGELYSQLSAVDAAQKSKSPPPAGGGAEKIKAAAGQQPAPIRAMLEQLADAGASQGRTAEIAGLATELKPIAEFCNRAITGRYPFASGAMSDVLPEDLGQLFGGGGLMDEFFQKRLANLVDTGTATWSYKPLGDGSKPVQAAALAEFQRAAHIKDVFFRSGGKTPAMKIEMRMAEIDPALKELTLDIDGKKARVDLIAASVFNPFQMKEIKQFRCPAAL